MTVMQQSQQFDPSLETGDFEEVDANDENETENLPGLENDPADDGSTEHDTAADEQDALSDGEVDEDDRSGPGRHSRDNVVEEKLAPTAQIVYGEADGPDREDQRDMNRAAPDEHL